MKKQILVVVVVFLVISMMFTACSPKVEEAEMKETVEAKEQEAVVEEGAAEVAVDLPKIVTLGGPLGETSFMDEAHSGMVRASEELPVICEYVEVVEAADYETQGRFLAESGDYDLIIFVGAQVADIVGLMAGDYPEQKMSVIDTKVEGFDNVRSVSAKNPEQAFLSGVLSGIVTKGEHKEAFPYSNDENVLCYSGGGDVPTSRSGAAGYIAGAKYVNPDVEVLYTIVGSWNDPDRAKEITLQGIERGADIATGNCGSGIKGVLSACKEQSANYIATSPADNDVDYSLSCSVKKTDMFVYNEINGIVEDAWASGHYSLGIAEGICDISFEGLAIEGNIPADIMSVIDEIREDIIDGSLSIPQDLEPDQVDAWAVNNQYQW